MAPGILIATETFATEIDGIPTIVHKNVTRVREGHPIALANPQNFEPVEDRVDHELPDIEQATAAPGEKRARRKTKPKAEQPAAEDSGDTAATADAPTAKKAPARKRPAAKK